MKEDLTYLNIIVLKNIAMKYEKFKNTNVYFALSIINFLGDKVKKVFIFPPNSLILGDLVERFGHKPLMLNNVIGQKVRTAEIDSPPLNITDEDPKKGLKYAAIEVPSGVRGRMSLIGPLIEEAEAAIIMKNAPIGFGCVGCERTNELTKYLIRRKGIPVLNVEYPKTEEEAKIVVKKIAAFLKELEEGDNGVSE
ncbi:methanogenesis marker protein 5 [Methanotorris igneus Kol 5]|uniref:Methanogenesis marker protein 5 n=1 Tax=Methanotorris igneus (strain DSM 5666 / JCM 11834 / Kol 5) TaxID=880724 RepID=F6BC55_METIK|nr:methanogenesis marker protein 5 [Methanotorris igneus Kol 5]